MFIKFALSYNDDKCFIMDNNTDTLTYDHYKIKNNSLNIDNNES